MSTPSKGNNKGGKLGFGHESKKKSSGPTFGKKSPAKAPTFGKKSEARHTNVEGTSVSKTPVKRKAPASKRAAADLPYSLTTPKGWTRN
jgi:hypothetical protein